MKHRLCLKCKKREYCHLGEYGYMRPILDNGCTGFHIATATNGDRIRAMSDEELAIYLSDLDACPDESRVPDRGVSACAIAGRVCKECWQEYITEPNEVQE